jgi:hypothetical protein
MDKQNMMEHAVTIKDGAPQSRRRSTSSQRKAVRGEEVVAQRAAMQRAPAKQREGGWGLYAWMAWQDRMFPGLSSTQREPLVCEICNIRSAMYYKLNSGTQFPSERVQRLCELAELASRVAREENTLNDAEVARRLLDSREAELILVAYHVFKGTVKPTIRKHAAEAVLLRQTTALQTQGKGAHLSDGV